MTATNHALTGAAIGLIVAQPILAIPLALVSHFICDMIPHYRSSIEGEKFLKTEGFKRYLIAEAFICTLIVLSIVLKQPINWQLAVICAFVAVSPDFMSIKRFLKARQNQKYKPGRYVSFASAIQWFERPIGGVVEIAWFVAALIIIAPFIS